MKKFVPLLLSFCALFLGSCSSMIDDFSDLKTKVNYTVQTYYESTSQADSYDEPVVQILKGVPGKETQAEASPREGFEIKPFVQEKISADGSTVVHIYYNRKRVTLNFYAYCEDGSQSSAKWSDTSTDSKAIIGRYGCPLSEEDLASLSSANLENGDWTFGGWNEKNIMDLPSVFPSADQSFYAVWFGTFYTVNYHFENVSDSSYSDDPAYPSVQEDKLGSGASVKVGDTVDSSNYTAPTVTGFTAEPIEAVTVTEDGSATVEVYYKRNIYTVTFNLNGGQRKDTVDDESTSINEVTAPFEVEGKFGAAVSAPSYSTDFNHDQDIKTYTWSFDGWDSEVPSTIPAENVNLYAQWTKTHSVYTVRYFFEDVNNLGSYVQDTGNYPDVIAAKAKIGSKTSVTASSIKGFKNPSITQVEVTSDATAVAEVKYERKTVSLTFKANGGSWSDATTEKVLEGKYGTSLTLPAEPSLTDSTFLAWYLEGTSTRANPTTFPDSDTTYEAYWAQSAATYTLEHWFEKADSEEYEINSAYTTTEKVGLDITGSAKPMTEASALSDIEGFIAKDFDQIEVNTDGSTTLKIYYDRKDVTLTFTLDGGSWSDATTADKIVTGKYGSVLTLPSSDDPEKEPYYSFVSWTPSVPSTIPSSPATYKATWKQVKADYTVTVRYEKLDGTYSVQSSSVSIGDVNTSTNISAENNLAGYELQSIKQETITSDGNAVVYVNYNRKNITYTFAPAGGSWSDSSLSSVSGKYGADVTSPDTSKLTRSGWVFGGWNETIPSTFGTEDKTFTAKWLPAASSSTTFAGEKDISLTVSAGTSKYTFTAGSVSGAVYEWYVDKELKSDFNTSRVSMTTSDLGGNGVHTVLVKVTDGNVVFTKSVSVTISE